MVVKRRIIDETIERDPVIKERIIEKEPRERNPTIIIEEDDV